MFRFRESAMKAAVVTVLVWIGCQAAVTQQRPPELCTRWIDVIWKFSVLDESSNIISKEDFSRFISFMDEDGIEVSVDMTEFDRYWRCTLMFLNDTEAIFGLIAGAGDEEGNDSTIISESNIDDFWDEYMGEVPSLTKDDFTQAWIDNILGQLPRSGCEDHTPNPDPMAERFCSQVLDGGF